MFADFDLRENMFENEKAVVLECTELLLQIHFKHFANSKKMMIGHFFFKNPLKKQDDFKKKNVCSKLSIFF